MAKTFFSVDYCLIFTVFFVNFEILMNLVSYCLPLKFRKVMFSVVYVFLPVILSVNGRSLFYGPSIKVPAPLCTGISPWTCSNLFISNLTVVQPNPPPPTNPIFCSLCHPHRRRVGGCHRTEMPSFGSILCYILQYQILLFLLIYDFCVTRVDEV